MRAFTTALLALALLAGAAAAAASAGYVTPEIVAAAAPRFAEVEPNRDDGTAAEGRQQHAQGGRHGAQGHAHVTRTPVPVLRSNEAPQLRTPYTFDNSQPAYRSTFYRYPWMHEPFGSKPAELARVPIGSHVEFPWQKEAREEYKDHKLRQEDERRGASAGRPHSLPHPLAFVPPEGQAPYAGQWPFVHPSQSAPFYPAAHPEVHQFGFFGAGAGGHHPSVLPFPHPYGPPGMPAPPIAPNHPAYLNGGLADPYYSASLYASPAMQAAMAPGAAPIPYGAAWYGAGTVDLI